MAADATAVPLPYHGCSALVLPLALSGSFIHAEAAQTPLALAVFAWFRSFTARSSAHYGPSVSSFLLLPQCLVLLIPLAGATHPKKLTPPSSSPAPCGSSVPCQVRRLQHGPCEHVVFPWAGNWGGPDVREEGLHL